MKAPSKKLPPTTDEDEVLRRMLHTPPKQHESKPAPKLAAKKREKGSP